MEGGELAFGHGRMKAFSVRGGGKGEASRPGRGQVFLAYTGWGGAVPVAENREIRQGKRYDFQREPSYGYSHLLL